MDATVSSVAGKVADKLFDEAKKSIDYIRNCSENVKTFKEEVVKLKALKETLEQRIRIAKDKAEDPGNDLKNWIKTANDKISEATTFITEEDKSKKTCCNVPFRVNLFILHHYGRMAKIQTSSLKQLKNEGEVFMNRVFDPLPNPGFLDCYIRKNLENIDTQKSSLKEIIQAMKDHQIVGIVGIGGVGKTTLAKEAAAKMKNQFDHIEIIAISQTVDVKMIKEDVQKASRKIKNGEKVLIILDDVWKEMDLEEVDIPCVEEFPNCKILLTSREKDVCEAMNSQKIITVDPLPKEEAWILFKRVVGMSDNDRRKPVALKIVAECGGLPLFILAVGKALRNKEIKTWESALDRLKDPTEKDVPFKNKGIMQLKFSYDYLESEVTKSCFLLCSLFPEDSRIDINKLTCYALGLGIFNKDDVTIQEANNRVRFAVDSLKSSFLLLHEGEDFFKMHDLVRDLAVCITSSGNKKFLVESGKVLREWKPRKDVIKSYKKISLMGNRICKLPDHELLFPELDTFLVQRNQLSDVPNEFFHGMKKLKVLDMSRNNISSLPQSLEQLSELTMLDLSENKSLCEISILGKLTCLEILKLADCGITNIPEEIVQLTKLRLLDLNKNESLCEISILGKLTCLEILKLARIGITNIPEEIGQLTNLRLLNIGGSDLSFVTPSVISNLIMLEELHLELSDKGNCEFLLELRELKSLKILHLLVPDLSYIPEDFHFETLLEFLITDLGYSNIYSDCKRFLQISKFNFSFAMPILKLIQLSESLALHGIEVLDNILPSLYREGVDELMYIILENCKNVRRLVKTCELGLMDTKGKFFSKLEEIRLRDLDSLEVLWDRPHPYISFCNLAKIKIENCNSLLELFPVSVAQGLVNLRMLHISNCKNLVVVISTTSESEIEETCGEQTGGNEIEEASASKTMQTGRSEIEQTGGSEIEETSGNKNKHMGGSETEMVKQDLDIVFPFLTSISLYRLPKLVSFYSGRSTIKYSSFYYLDVSNCGSMKRWSCGENHIPYKFQHEGKPYRDINDYIEAQLKMNGKFNVTCHGGIQREQFTLKGYLESVLKLKGLDIDTIRQHHTI